MFKQLRKLKLVPSPKSQVAAFEAFGEMTWVVAEAHTGEYPFQVRWRQFAEQFPFADFPHRLNIFWALRYPTDEGMASVEDLVELHVFEKRLAEAVENDKFAVMSVALTGRKDREFVFHTSDPKAFVRRLSEMPQEEAPYPIQIQANKDPSWEYVHGVMSDIGAALVKPS